MTEYAIRLKDITKSYNMYAKPSDRFREALNPFKKSYHDVFYALKNVNPVRWKSKGKSLLC